MRIAIVINTSWNIFNFRYSLIKALLADGHDVVAIAPRDSYTQRLLDAGCSFVHIPMEKGTNPFTDMRLTWRLYQTYQRVQPDVVLHYTIKPNIYGAIAAHFAKVPAINNVSGLGTVFIVKDHISAIAVRLYKYAFRYPAKVFFQNEDDRQLFLRHKLVKPAKTDVLPGSGIDLERFQPATAFKRHTPFTFLMIARVLYEKGIVEYIEACKLVKAQHPDVKFQLLGLVDERSRSGIKKAKLDAWLATGEIEYLGTTDDVAPVIAASDCVVLPSYREGTPRTLLEAAAMAKPLIATNVPGCREVVKDNENGLLCRLRSSEDLAAKMLQMLRLPDNRLKEKGLQSRKLAETKFGDRFVIEKYLQAIAEVVK